jgi:hypothetical protein
MADLEEEFSPVDVPEDDRAFEPIPAGTYKLQVINSLMKDTKSGSGRVLELTVEIVDGKYAGRHWREWINYRNQNEDAQRIGIRAFADLCLGVGIHDPIKSSELVHFKPFVARVTVDPGNGQFSPQNKIQYKSIKSAAALPPQKSTPVPPAKPKPQATKAQPAKPWARKKEDEDEIPY